jgi:hypothetical protein
VLSPCILLLRAPFMGGALSEQHRPLHVVYGLNEDQARSYIQHFFRQLRVVHDHHQLAGRATRLHVLVRLNYLVQLVGLVDGDGVLARSHTINHLLKDLLRKVLGPAAVLEKTLR